MKNLKLIRCIKIVHPVSNIKEYRILSGFFRFVGIFVCEKTTGNKKETDEDTDFKIELDSKKIEKYNGSDMEQTIIMKAVDGVFKLEEMQQDNYNPLKKLWEQIIRIFVDNQLMRGSYALAYFGDAMDYQIYQFMDNAHRRFSNALQEYNELLEGKKETGELYWKDLSEYNAKQMKKYVLLACSNCKRRMNEIYNILWEGIVSGRSIKDFYRNDIQQIEKKRNDAKKNLWVKTFYHQDDMDKELGEVLNIDPDCFAVYAIRGFAAELDDSQGIGAVNDLLRAVSMIGEHSYSSYILYRIGKYYEKLKVGEESVMRYYECAYERDSNNYRALYKLAAQKQNNQEYEKAEEYWKKLLEILEERKGFLQPIEQAYLYKTYRNRGKAFFRIGQYNQSIAMLKKALEIAGEEDEIFYPWMFQKIGNELDEKWKYYKKAARYKLELKRCYYDLATVSFKLNELENNRKYLLLMSEEEKKEKEYLQGKS